MSDLEIRLCDGEKIAALLETMAEDLASERDGSRPLYLVGVHTRGFPIACRLAAALGNLVGGEVPVGALDITLYRDDLEQAPHWPVLRGTEIPFEVEGADLILVDDVLFTGRTIRAALNSVCDLGRPARVRLAVLIDRGHRELPIQPDVVGMTIETGRDDHVRVLVKPVDPVDEIVLVRST